MNTAARPPAAIAGALLARSLGLWLAAAVSLVVLPGLAGCREGDAAAPTSASRLAVATLEAPAAQADRHGDWRGGPEPVSGKLRSGIVSWWRLVPAQPLAGVPFDLLLRLEDVQGADAAVSVSAGDGARLADADAPQRWTLRPGQPAQLAVRLVAPAGDRYLHVTTLQHARSSVRSIRLALQPGSVASAPTRGDSTVDARGEPIVRLPAGH